MWGTYCILAPTVFNTCMDNVLETKSETLGSGVSFGTVRITNLDFANDAVIIHLDNRSSCRGTRFDERGSRVAWIAGFLNRYQGPGVP